MSTQEATPTAKAPRIIAGIPLRDFFIPVNSRIQAGRYNWPMLKSIVSLICGAVAGGVVGFMTYAIPFVPTVAFVLSAPFLAVGGAARVIGFMLPPGDKKIRMKSIGNSNLVKGGLLLGFPLLLATVPFFAATHAALTGVEAALRKVTGRTATAPAVETPVAAPAVEPKASIGLAAAKLTEAFEAGQQPAEKPAAPAQVKPAKEKAPKS